jgi:hypothetical protein
MSNLLRLMAVASVCGLALAVLITLLTVLVGRSGVFGKKEEWRAALRRDRGPTGGAARPQFYGSLEEFNIAGSLNDGNPGQRDEFARKLLGWRDR